MELPKLANANADSLRDLELIFVVEKHVHIFDNLDDRGNPFAQHRLSLDEVDQLIQLLHILRLFHRSFLGELDDDVVRVQRPYLRSGSFHNPFHIRDIFANGVFGVERYSKKSETATSHQSQNYVTEDDCYKKSSRSNS